MFGHGRRSGAAPGAVGRASRRAVGGRRSSGRSRVLGRAAGFLGEAWGPGRTAGSRANRAASAVVRSRHGSCAQPAITHGAGPSRVSVRVRAEACGEVAGCGLSAVCGIHSACICPPQFAVCWRSACCVVLNRAALCGIVLLCRSYGQAASAGCLGAACTDRVPVSVVVGPPAAKWSRISTPHLTPRISSFAVRCATVDRGWVFCGGDAATTAFRCDRTERRPSSGPPHSSIWSTPNVSTPSPCRFG